MPSTYGFAIPPSALSSMASYTTPTPAELAEMDPLPLSLEIAKSQLPRIAALAFAYWISAKHAHPIQLAAAALPPAPPLSSLSPEALASIHRRARHGIIYACVLVLSALGVELFFNSSRSQGGVVDDEDENAAAAGRSFVRRSFPWVVAYLVFQQVVVLASKWLLPWEVVRSPGSGIPAQRVDRSQWAHGFRGIGIVVAAATYAWLVVGEPATPVWLRQIAATATLATLSARPLGKTVSIRKTIIGLLAFEAVMITLCLMTVSVCLYFSGFFSAGSPSSAPPTDDDSLDTTSPSASASSHSDVFGAVAPLVPALYASLNTFLIVICWRFDYSNSLRSSPSPSSTPPVVVRKDEHGLHAASLPSPAPSRFPRPYFLSSLVLTLLSHLSAPILLGLFATQSRFLLSTREDSDTPSPAVLELLDGSLRDITAGWMAPFIAAPTAALGVLGLACVRGEAKRVWTYEELWVRRQEDEEREAVEGKGEVRLEEGSEGEEEEEEGQKTPTAKVPAIVVQDLDKTPKL